MSESIPSLLESLPLTKVDAAGSAASATSEVAGGKGGFGRILARALEGVMKPQEAAQGAVNQFAAGADGELHRTMLAVERADISLKFFVSMRNKALEAYREIMHMGS